jgi:hypothetical protein
VGAVLVGVVVGNLRVGVRLPLMLLQMLRMLVVVVVVVLWGGRLRGERWVVMVDGMVWCGMIVGW